MGIGRPLRTMPRLDKSFTPDTPVRDENVDEGYYIPPVVGPTERGRSIGTTAPGAVPPSTFGTTPPSRVQSPMVPATPPPPTGTAYVGGTVPREGIPGGYGGTSSGAVQVTLPGYAGGSSIFSGSTPGGVDVRQAAINVAKGFPVSVNSPVLAQQIQELAAQFSIQGLPEAGIVPLQLAQAAATPTPYYHPEASVPKVPAAPTAGGGPSPFDAMIQGTPAAGAQYNSQADLINQTFQQNKRTIDEFFSRENAYGSPAHAERLVQLMGQRDKAMRETQAQVMREFGNAMGTPSAVAQQNLQKNVAALQGIGARAQVPTRGGGAGGTSLLNAFIKQQGEERLAGIEAKQKRLEKEQERAEKQAATDALARLLGRDPAQLRDVDPKDLLTLERDIQLQRHRGVTEAQGERKTTTAEATFSRRFGPGGVEEKRHGLEKEKFQLSQSEFERRKQEDAYQKQKDLVQMQKDIEKQFVDEEKRIYDMSRDAEQDEMARQKFDLEVQKSTDLWLDRYRRASLNQKNYDRLVQEGKDRAEREGRKMTAQEKQAELAQKREARIASQAYAKMVYGFASKIASSEYNILRDNAADKTKVTPLSPWLRVNLPYFRRIVEEELKAQGMTPPGSPPVLTAPPSPTATPLPTSYSEFMGGFGEGGGEEGGEEEVVEEEEVGEEEEEEIWEE